MEIVSDQYLLDKGFSISWINANAKAMGSLRARPRRFIRDKVDQFLLKVAEDSQSEYKTPQMRKAEVDRKVASVLENHNNKKGVRQSG